jgi:hypothetical protein
MTSERDTLSILQAVEAGDLDVEQAIRALESGEPASASGTQAEPATPTAWFVLLATAIALTAGGGYLGSLGGWWWLLAGPLLLVGGALLLVALASYRSPWLRLHIRSARTDWPIHLAFPLPLGLVARLVRLVSPFVPEARWQGVDQVLLAMEDELPPGHSLVVDLSDGVDGEQVDIHWD